MTKRGLNFTSEEDAILRKFYPIEGARACWHRLLGKRNLAAIRCRAIQVLGLKVIKECKAKLPRGTNPYRSDKGQYIKKEKTVADVEITVEQVKGLDQVIKNWNSKRRQPSADASSTSESEL